jgi:U3 small nucleolar RNA-associated protein 18
LELFELSPNNKFILFLGARNSIIVVSKQTKRTLKTLQIPNKITCLRFSHYDYDYQQKQSEEEQLQLSESGFGSGSDSQSQRMFVLTENAFVYIFDLSNYRCLDCISCMGIVRGMTFDVYSKLNLMAVGCNSGVVGVYHYSETDNDNNSNNSNDSNVRLLNSIYDISNCVTSLSGVSFNHDGQLLCVRSHLKKQALRLVHVRSGRVYSNWPKDRGLYFVYKTQLSPHSGYLAVGNDTGFVHLDVFFQFGVYAFVCKTQ